MAMLLQLSRTLLKAFAKIAVPKRADTLERAFSYANELSIWRLAERYATATIYAAVHG
jgi:hypothetical protein